MIHSILYCPKLKRQLAELANLLDTKIPWQLVGLHSLSLLACPKIQLPVAPSVPAFHFTNTDELCSCPAVLQRE